MVLSYIKRNAKDYEDLKKAVRNRDFRFKKMGSNQRFFNKMKVFCTPTIY